MIMPQNYQHREARNDLKSPENCLCGPIWKEAIPYQPGEHHTLSLLA